MEADAFLIRKTFTVDSIGQRIPTEVRTAFDCHEISITRNEFDAAGRNGLSADMALVTQAVNYTGEEIVEYNGERYGVYRTYRNPESDEIELYMEKKGGV